jgi:hypothetical protein
MVVDFIVILLPEVARHVARIAVRAPEVIYAKG